MTATGVGVRGGNATARKPLNRQTPRGRRANMPLLMAAILLIVGTAVALAWLFAAMGGRTSVLVAARQIPAGHVIAAEDLAEAQLAGSGVDMVRAADRGQLLGKTAVSAVPGGALFSQEMVTANPKPGPGQVAVGIALKPGQMPADLKQGQRVNVFSVVTTAPQAGAAGTQDGGGSLLAPGAEVLSVSSAGAGGLIVTVVVAERAAAEVTQTAVQGRVALVLLPLGAGS